MTSQTVQNYLAFPGTRTRERDGVREIYDEAAGLWVTEEQLEVNLAARSRARSVLGSGEAAAEMNRLGL